MKHAQHLRQCAKDIVAELFRILKQRGPREQGNQRLPGETMMFQRRSQWIYAAAARRAAATTGQLVNGRSWQVLERRDQPLQPASGRTKERPRSVSPVAA